MNRKDIFKRCLESIRLQKFANYEIIIVDNNSSDGTREMIQSFFPGVSYFYLGKNHGVAGGRNYGIRRASGKVCVFIDDDACFDDNKALENVEAYFKTDDQLGCLAFRVVQPGEDFEEYKSIPRADKKISNGDYECSYFCGAGFACRRDLFMEVGMFWDELFYIGEELDFSYRLVDKKYKILRSSAISVIHYETPQARVKGKWIYYGVRSRCWVAIRNLPWIRVFSHTFLWWGYYFILSLRNRHLIYFMQGVKDALTGVPPAMRSRLCISKETMNKLKKLSGRVYY